MKITAVDFFCGCGGTSYGFKKAGIDVKIGIDVDPKCKEIYEKNIKGSRFICKDLTVIKPEELLVEFDICDNTKLLFSACAPCQPFSTHFRGIKNDSRKNLLLDFLRFIEFYQPDYLFIENVPGIQTDTNNNILDRFKKRLRKLNYYFESNIVDTKDYGVPQSRKRFILIGSLNYYNVSISMPPETHGKGLKPYKTVKDAIGYLPRIKAGSKHKTINAHSCRSLSELNLLRMKATPKNGGDRISWPKNLQLDCHKTHNGHSDVYGRMKWDIPSPALTCKCISISNGRFGHPTQNRAISLREAASIQTFPKSFKFNDNLEQMSKQIGNAVPPQLATVFGKWLFKLANQAV